MTWSNILVYSCEYVCFVLFYFTVLSCECIFLCVLCYLMFTDMFHIQMQLMHRLDHWNEYICMYVWMEWKRKIIFLRHVLWMITFFVHDNKVLQLTIKLDRNNPRMKHNLHEDFQWVVLYRVPWRISSNKLEVCWGILVWCPRRRWENSFWVATHEVPMLQLIMITDTSNFSYNLCNLFTIEVTSS